jgi:hypothetical protein
MAQDQPVPALWSAAGQRKRAPVCCAVSPLTAHVDIAVVGIRTKRWARFSSLPKIDPKLPCSAVQRAPPSGNAVISVAAAGYRAESNGRHNTEAHFPARAADAIFPGNFDPGRAVFNTGTAPSCRLAASFISSPRSILLRRVAIGRFC